MHTVLTLQVAIGIVAADFDGTGLDACLVAFLQVGNGSLVTMSLGIAQVHAHQHAGPVLALCTTCTGVDFEHTVHLVGFLAQHILQFESFDSFGCFGIGLVHFLFSHQLVLVEVECQLQFVRKGFHFVVAGNPLLESFHFPHLCFGGFLVVPKAGGLCAKLFFLHLDFLAFDVQVAVQRLGTVFDIFQLFSGYHNENTLFRNAKV